MHDIFLSYCSDDRGAVLDIKEGLDAEGFSVWWDPRIPGGTEWRRTIVEQLAQTRCVVVVWSRASVDATRGKWVQQEADEAERRGVYVPTHIDEVLPPIGLRHVQSVDLVDWHGDRTDPRWRRLVEAVRDKIEGRAPEPTAEPPRPPLLRGRLMLLALLAGLVALIVALTVRFGLPMAAGVSAALVLGYFALDLLLARRRGERAASDWLRRLLRKSGFSAATAAVLWLGTVLVAASPWFERMLYAEFVLTVQDESLKPLPNALVSIVGAVEAPTLSPDAEGRLRIRYPRYGSAGFVLRVSLGDRSVSLEHGRGADGALADVTVRLFSGSSPFRVAHWTAEELAIDALVQGRMPKAVRSLFPNVTQVLVNPVWHEVNAFLDAFGAASGADVVDGGHTLDGKAVEESGGGSLGDAASLRWAREVELEASPRGEPGDASNSGRGLLFTVNTDGRLHEAISVVLGPPEWHFAADAATPLEGAAARLRELLGPNGFDEQGRVPLVFERQVDSALLKMLNAGDGPLDVRPGKYHGDVDPWLYLTWFASRNPPDSMMHATVEVLEHESCGSGNSGRWIERLKLQGPRPALRVTVIENSSERNVPISEIHYALATAQGFRTLPDTAITPDNLPDVVLSQRVDRDPLPGGVLRPGEAIVVPRRFLFKTERRTAHPTVLPAADGTMLPFRFDETIGEAEEDRPRETRSHRFVVESKQFFKAPPEAGEEDLKPETMDAWSVGPVIKSLAVMVNGVLVPTRDDSGRTLALHASQPWGSCPFVFARHQGQSVWRNHGMTIADQIGAASEATHRLALGRGVQRVQLRELEPEVSYINAARLFVRSADGRMRTYAASDSRLATQDGQYAVLQRGDVLDIDFQGFRGAAVDDEVSIEMTGWYQPLPQRITDLAARRPLR